MFTPTVTSPQNGANYYDLPKHHKMLHYFHALFQTQAKLCMEYCKEVTLIRIR